MAHYAYLNEKNIVFQIIIGRDEDDLPDGISSWEEYFKQKPGVYDCKRTSYNTRNNLHYSPETGALSDDQSKAFRGNYAGIGFFYNEQIDAFIPPKPFDSWMFNEKSLSWDSPVKYPEDGFIHSWDEESFGWVKQ